MADPSKALISRWDRLLPRASELGVDLVAAYGSPSRRYHDLRHLTQVLDAIDRLAQESVDLDVDVVRLAAWFHDAVYDVRAGDNEERSAQWAESALAKAGLPPEDVAEVARLVRLTASHAAMPGDANGIVLCDADLSILAGSPDDYAAYTQAVREEYAHVPEPEFRHGRAAILQQLLDLPRLFGTALGRRDWEPIARSNLAAEARALSHH